MPDSGAARFDNPADPCEGLGFTNDLESDIEVVGGQMRITPFANIATTAGGCIGELDQAFDTGGVFIEVTTAVTGPAEYMFIGVAWDDLVSTSSVTRGGNLLIFEDQDGLELGATPIGPARWWRIRPRGDRLAVVAETSPDGRVWTVFGTDNRPPPMRVKINFALGTFAPEAAPTTAVIDGINVCPEA
jgi:hypothetical protein